MAISNDEFILFLTLAQRAREEKSMYARLLFQENILSASIIATLHTIADYLNTAVTTSVLTDERSFQSKQIFEIAFDQEALEGLELGRLFAVLKPFLNQHKSLRADLKSFVDYRNRISHNMLKYKSIDELEKDSEKAVEIGELTLHSLTEFRYSMQSKQ